MEYYTRFRSSRLSFQGSFIMMAGMMILAVAALSAEAPVMPGDEPVATFSIVARDSVTGELGIAVASKFFAVGSVVP